MTDPREGTPTVPTSQASTSSTAAPPIQVVQHSTSGPKGIRMQAIITDSDPDETGRRWKKWKNELLTKFRYFPHLKRSGSCRRSSHLRRRTNSGADRNAGKRSYTFTTRKLSPSSTTISFPWLTQTALVAS